MNTKAKSILAAVIGSLCIAYAYWWLDAAMSVVRAVPSAAGGLDDRHFWWPFWSGVALLALACFWFVRHLWRRRFPR
ncbi:MAG: hypothetical protein IH623_19360 [Verrucomicrobia bacterium]|nr:hypothetical protein [Verrucomicrobiota bacterium]